MKTGKSKKAAGKSARAPRVSRGTAEPASEPRAGNGKLAEQRARLERELRSAMAEIDEQGLLFLLRQAQVLVHNARVESLKQEKPRAAESSRPRKAAESPSSSRAETVSIEPGKGGIFVTLGRVRKVLSAEEMKRLVRICYGAPTRSEALHQLFTVLVKERRDILSDAFIGSPESPLLRGLFDAVRETYHLEDR